MDLRPLRDIRGISRSRVFMGLFWGILGLLGLGFSLSYALTGHSIFGILILFLVPLLQKLIPIPFFFQHRKRLRESSISFLYGMLSLTRAGLSFPSVLFSLSKTNSFFAREIQKHLVKYQSGESLGNCLSNFAREIEANWLIVLEAAYRRGLSIGPFLERLIPALEKKHELESRLVRLQMNAIAQITFMFLLPWGLQLFLFGFQPELKTAFLHSTEFIVIFFISLSLQMIGGCLIWRFSINY